MKAVVLSISALFLSIALLVSGSAMLGTLISLRLDLLGIRGATLGFIMAFYSVGFVLGATYGTRIIREVGHIRAFAVYAAIACAATLLHPLVERVEGLAVLRLVIGYCLAGLMTVAESWVNDRATAESRGKLLGIYTINFYLSSSLGQLLVGFNDPINFAAYTVVAVLIVMSLVPLSLTRSLIPTAPSNTDHIRLRHLIKQAPSGITGALVSGVALGGFVALAPVYAARSGLSLEQLSGYMAFTVLCAIVLQWPAGWLSDKLGRLPVLTAALMFSGLAAIATAILGTIALPFLFIFSAAFFALASSTYPLSVALTNDQLPNDQLVAACAALLRTYGIGTVIGPLLGGLAIQLLGASALFLFIGASLLIAGAAIQFVFRPSDEVPVEEQGEYVTISPVSTPVLSEIDPRNEEFEQHHAGEPADWDLADKIEMLIPDDAGAHEHHQFDKDVEEERAKAANE